LLIGSRRTLLPGAIAAAGFAVAVLGGSRATMGLLAIGIILTGMGDDGANGMDFLHQAGGLTIAQDKESCVVYGMPNEAVIRNAVDAQMNLGEIASFLKYLGEAKMNSFKPEDGAL